MWIHTIIQENPGLDRDMIQNIQRSARSSARNIAEGFGRHHHKENIQFCRIAKGSLHEIIEDLNIIKDEGKLNQLNFEEGRILLSIALKSLNGCINYLLS